MIAWKTAEVSSLLPFLLLGGARKWTAGSSMKSISEHRKVMIAGVPGSEAERGFVETHPAADIAHGGLFISIGSKALGCGIQYPPFLAGTHIQTIKRFV